MCIWCKGRANNTTQINTTYNTGFGILPLLSKGVILGTVRWHIQGLTYILILYNWYYIYIHVYKEHMCMWRKGRGNNTYTLTARGSWQQEIRYTAIDGWHNVNAVSCSACPGVSDQPIKLFKTGCAPGARWARACHGIMKGPIWNHSGRLVRAPHNSKKLDLIRYTAMDSFDM